MKKKVLATLLTAAMLATTLAGCGSGAADSGTPSADEEAAEKVDITAYIWYNVIIQYRR